MKPAASLFVLALAALACAPATAWAAALRVTPVGLEMPAGQNAATVTLRNDDAAPMHVQVRVFLWRQVDGADVLEPTTEVVASPPITRLEPQAEQVVRLIRLAPDAPVREESYRLIVDELPAPPETPDGR